MYLKDDMTKCTENLQKSNQVRYDGKDSNDTKLIAIQWFETYGYFWILVPYKIIISQVQTLTIFNSDLGI